MKRSPLKRTAFKRKGKSIYEKLDALWFKILKHERGEVDEIDGRPANGLGTFHILCKKNHPRLRYARENSLLVNWLPHHFNWHHYTHNDEQYQVVDRAIVKLRGKDYKLQLMAIEYTMPKHSKIYLQSLHEAFKAILHSYGEKI